MTAQNQPPTATDQDAPRTPFGADGVLGQIMWLMMNSTPHKHLFLEDMEWLVLPAVRLRQFRVLTDGNMPGVYASWAFLSEKAEAKLTSGIGRLEPEEWNSGDALWLVDVIAPRGGTEAMIRDLRENVFPDRKIKALQPSIDGKGTQVVEWKGGT